MMIEVKYYESGKGLPRNLDIPQRDFEVEKGIGRETSIRAEINEQEDVSELEKKLIGKNSQIEYSYQKNIEESAEEWIFYKESIPERYLPYEPVEKTSQKELFHKRSSYIDKYIIEVKPWWYIKYRTVAQNLRNITLGRGIISELENRGLINVVKKVK